MGRPPTCECGVCDKCARRERHRLAYQSKSPEERRGIVLARDPEKVRAADRARYARDHVKRLDAMKKYQREHPEIHNRLIREWAVRNPQQHRANWMTSNAIRDGRLVREPCEACGVIPAQAHHDDYSRPLDVRWLCSTHHVAHHHARVA